MTSTNPMLNLIRLEDPSNLAPPQIQSRLTLTNVGRLPSPGRTAQLSCSRVIQTPGSGLDGLASPRIRHRADELRRKVSA